MRVHPQRATLLEQTRERVPLAQARERAAVQKNEEERAPSPRAIHMNESIYNFSANRQTDPAIPANPHANFELDGGPMSAVAARSHRSSAEPFANSPFL